MLEGADPEKKWGDKEPLKNSGTEKKFNPSNLTNVRLFKK
jgi:hypothetical protein